jgi:hypothetical protein
MKASYLYTAERTVNTSYSATDLIQLIKKLAVYHRDCTSVSDGEHVPGPLTLIDDKDSGRAPIGAGRSKVQYRRYMFLDRPLQQTTMSPGMQSAATDISSTHQCHFHD